MHRLASLSIALALPLLLLPKSGETGPLAKTARAVDQKSSNSSSPSSRSSSSSRDSDNRADHRDNRTDHRDDSDSSSSSSYSGFRMAPTYVAPPLLNAEAQPIALTPKLSFGLAAQDVYDSDGSLRFSGDLHFGILGVYGAADYYYEKISDGENKTLMEDEVRMNLYEVALQAKIPVDGPFDLSFRLGAAVSSSTHFDTLSGGVAGLRVGAKLRKKVHLRAEGRTMSFENDISAMDAVFGAQFAPLWVGYRALRFDFGDSSDAPIMHGPEVGLRLEI